jgi:hypothetical protein
MTVAYNNSELTPQEIDDYGEEFLSVVGKKARAEARQEFAGTVQGLQQEVQGLRNQVARNDRQNMMATLDREVPNWRSINEDSRMLQALEARNEYTGAKYADELKAAWARNDIGVVLNYFRKASDDMNASKPPPDTRPLQNGPRGYYRADNPPDSAYLTRAEIAKFHSDVARGYYRDRQAEKDAFDRRMIDAANKGLIR